MSSSNEIEKYDSLNEEIIWCIQSLNGIQINKTTKDYDKVVKLLTDPKTPFLKKRVLMNSYFKDYRKKMDQEKAKYGFKENKLKVKTKPNQVHGKVYKKRSKLEQSNDGCGGGDGSDGVNEFKFNFDSNNET